MTERLLPFDELIQHKKEEAQKIVNLFLGNIPTFSFSVDHITTQRVKHHTRQGILKRDAVVLTIALQSNLLSDIERDQISHHKGIPNLGLPPVEQPVDPIKLLADIKRLEEIEEVRIRKRPKHGRT